MSVEPQDTIPVYAPPRVPEPLREVLAIHLQRFLLPVLDPQGVNEVRVIVGFEGSAVGGLCVHISIDGIEVEELSQSFEALTDAYRGAATHLNLEGEKEKRRWHAYPVVVEESALEHLVAFVLFEEVPLSGLLKEARLRVREAIRAFRSNGLRLLFNERGEMGLKPFVYRLLDQLPSWCGVDHSAALILTSNLEAMALRPSVEAEFEIVAERLYYEPPEEDTPPFERLIGLTISAQCSEDGCKSLLGYAFEEVRQKPSTQLNIFVSDDEGGNWFVFGEPEHIAERFATHVHRPGERMTVLIPLLSQNELGAPDLLGFLSINYREPGPISDLTSETLTSLAGRLAHFLRRSSMFSLSARQLLLLNDVRKTFEAAKGLEDYVAALNQRVVASTRIPCFALGLLAEAEGRRYLRFVSPQGFTRFEDIDLDVELADQRVSGSSIASLAVRLKKPVVLAGGKDEDGAHVFENQCFVNEKEAEILDVRRVDKASLETSEWRPLSDYYMPSREESYATLAFPVILSGEVLGVIAVEVDRNTEWIWWNGFGSQTFYQLLANELAVALKLLSTGG